MTHIMVPTFCVHLERADDGPSWWATSDDVPGLTAAAGTLDELRNRIRAVLIDLSVGDGSFREVLAGPTDPVLHRTVVAV